MIRIEYELNHAPSIVNSIASSLGMKAKNGFLIHKDGTVVGKQLNESISLYAGYFKMSDDYTVARIGTDNDDLVSLDFILNTTALLWNHENDTKSKQIFGSYLSSSNFESEVTYDQNKYSRFLTIIFDKNWIGTEVFLNRYDLCAFVKSTHKYLLFRELDREINKEILDLFQYIFSENDIVPTYLLGACLKIITRFFQKFQLNQYRTEINPSDLNGIVKAKSHIDSNMGSHIQIKDLLEISSMSQTKFNRLFKLVFDISPGEYHKKVRIWKSKELIEAGHSVSSAVISVGYTNHSYFTRSFKKEFGLTPSEYISELKALKRD